MSNILQKICTDTRARVAERKKLHSFSSLDATSWPTTPLRGFTKALEGKRSAGEIGFITEIKKASPSAGLIRDHFSPSELAVSYESARAACLSVLTDEPYFQGKNEDLIAARQVCKLPVLRKDFILDVWQITESRAIGADCILLIMAALDDAMAADLHAAAVGYGMDVLIETHNEAELERALRLPTGMIGINNRNLNTLEIDLGISERLSKLVPAGRLVVSESGIKNADSIKRLQAAGIGCFLVGESLLKQPDVAEALVKLRS
jgi:indole-3-glycerol phosphate synthase